MEAVKTRINGVTPLRRVVVMNQTHYISIPLEHWRQWNVADLCPTTNLRIRYVHPE